MRFTLQEYSYVEEATFLKCTAILIITTSIFRKREWIQPPSRTREMTESELPWFPCIAGFEEAAAEAAASSVGGAGAPSYSDWLWKSETLEGNKLKVTFLNDVPSRGWTLSDGTLITKEMIINWANAWSRQPRERGLNGSVPEFEELDKSEIIQSHVRVKFVPGEWLCYNNVKFSLSLADLHVQSVWQYGYTVLPNQTCRKTTACQVTWGFFPVVMQVGGFAATQQQQIHCSCLANLHSSNVHSCQPS